MKWEYLCKRVTVREVANNSQTGVPVYYEPEENTMYDATFMGLNRWELVAVHSGWAYFKREVDEARAEELKRLKLSWRE